MHKVRRYATALKIQIEYRLYDSFLFLRINFDEPLIFKAVSIPTKFSMSHMYFPMF
jgi:hypothetical protein